MDFVQFWANFFRFIDEKEQHRHKIFQFFFHANNRQHPLPSIATKKNPKSNMKASKTREIIDFVQF